MKYIYSFEKIKENISFNEIIEQEKLNLDIDLIKDELSKEDLAKIDKKELIIDDNNKIQYYQEFDIISKELKEYLEEYDLIQPNQEIIEIECIFINNKIIINSFNNNKKISIVISKNGKDEYISELIIEFNDEETLQNYLKLIIEKGYDYMIDLLNIKENEKKY